MKRTGPELVKSTNKTVRRDQLGSLKNIRFEDVCTILENEHKALEKAPRVQKTQQDIDDLNSFSLLDLKGNKIMLEDYLLTENELNATFNFAPLVHDERTRGGIMTFADIVDEVFENDLLDGLIKWNVEHAKDGDLPGIMFGKNPSMSHRSF
jgi:hypothetical protein